MERMDGILAAKTFVQAHFPDSLAALLSGSVARGQADAKSDLDILIVAHSQTRCLRKSFRDYGWVIEVFVGSQEFHQEKITKRPRTNHSPSFLKSWAEAIILKDHNNFAQGLKEKALTMLEQGPDSLSTQAVDEYRYVITDWLDNLMSSDSYEEGLFIAYDVVSKAAELLLALDTRWIAERQWLYEALQDSGHPKGLQLVDAMKRFYRTGEKHTLVLAVESVLEPVGGRLYEGYSSVG